MSSLICGIRKQMNKQNETVTDSLIQRTNWWLPEGWEWGMGQISEGD